MERCGPDPQIRTRRPLLPLDDFEEAQPLYLFERASTGTADPARDFLDRIAADDFARALEDPPEPFRQWATLEDLTYQQIADVVESPVGTIRSRLHRGRALLQQRLWRFAEDHGLAGGHAQTPNG
jgi:RNA polymerase sigma-70 factor, ECF subfamily